MQSYNRIQKLFITGLAVCALILGNAFAKVAPEQGAHNEAQVASHDVIEPVVINLATPDVIQSLETDWLHKPSEVQFAKLDESTQFSKVFWISVGTFLFILLTVVYLGMSGAFARYRLSFKLGLSFGIMIALVCFLGIANEVYLKRLDGVAHYDTEILHLEEIGSEQHIAQNNYLLHGLSNHQYGEEQLAILWELIERYHKKIDYLDNNPNAQESHRALFGKLEDNIDKYEVRLKEVVHSFTNIEAGKEKLEHYNDAMKQALENMAHHHADLLFALEAEGKDLKSIHQQTLILKHLEEAEIAALSTTIEEVTFLIDKKPERISKMEHSMGTCQALLNVLSHEITEVDELALLKKLKSQTQDYVKQLRKMIADEAIIQKDLGYMAKQLDESRKATAELAHVAVLQANELEKEGELASILASAFSMLTGILLATFVTRSVYGPLKTAVDSLSDGATQTDMVSGQVSTGSQSLADGASTQAAALEQTSASLEEISSTTKNNADHATEANELARETCVAADKGMEEMEVMGQAMNDIQSSSDEISNIIKTIDDIAFQTNILALNAAVEAARAGEAGMGFAVVADEVRNLAQRSAVASKETAEKIEGAIQKSTHGVQISVRMKESLNTILGKAKQLDELLEHIASASTEQSQGITQVNQAVTQMETVTQANAASAEETASASEELSAQARSLRTIVNELETIIAGGSSKGNSTTTAPSTSSPGSAGFNSQDDWLEEPLHSPATNGAQKEKEMTFI